MDIDEYFAERDRESVRKRLHNALEEVAVSQNYIRICREMPSFETEKSLSWQEKMLRRTNGNMKSAITRASKLLPSEEVDRIIKAAEGSGKNLAWARFALKANINEHER